MSEYIYMTYCDEEGYDVVEYSSEYKQVVYNIDDGYGGVSPLSESDLVKMLERVREFKEDNNE